MAKPFRLPNPMIAVVWLAFFVPGHLHDWWVERGFIAAVFLLAGLSLLFKPASPDASHRDARRALLFFAVAQLLYVLSFINSVAFNGIETGPRDAYELGRFVFLGAFTVYLLRHYDERVRASASSAVLAALYYSLAVLICLKWTVPALTPFFTALYADTKTFVDAAGRLRLAAPFENPNFLGFFAAQALAYILFAPRLAMRPAHALAALLVLFFTGSRTAWIAAVLVLAAAAASYAYLAAMRARLKFALQLAALIFLLTIAGVRYADTMKGSYRVQRVLTALSRGGLHREANLASRLKQADRVSDFVRRSPLLGWGPSKYATLAYVDSQYLLWALRLGLLGAVWMIGGLLYAVVRLILAQRGDPAALAGAGAHAMAVLVMLLAGAFLDNFRLFYATCFVSMLLARPRA